MGAMGSDGYLESVAVDGLDHVAHDFLEGVPQGFIGDIFGKERQDFALHLADLAFVNAEADEQCELAHRLVDRLLAQPTDFDHFQVGDELLGVEHSV